MVKEEGLAMNNFYNAEMDGRIKIWSVANGK